jgi:Arc/MetJ-type ribon-helix-helix transcriptional regulator
MTTVNISITDDQAKFVDRISSKYNFSNRSELFRSLLRLVQQQPNLISQSSILPFQAPSTRSRSQLMKDFKATGLYSPEFLKDLKEGLDDDVYFNQK